jgi:hypothetical protein
MRHPSILYKPPRYALPFVLHPIQYGKPTTATKLSIPTPSSATSRTINATFQIPSNTPALPPAMARKRKLTQAESSESSSESSESSQSPQPPVPAASPKVARTPQKERKATNVRGVRQDGTLTETARIYITLRFDSTKARALQAEQIRTLIRQSGCTGVKHESAHELMYTILFVDATTLLHFRQFQGMWEYRTLSATAGGPRAEWWTAFRWFLRDCFSKAKTQIDKSGFTSTKRFSDESNKGVMPRYATLEEVESQEERPNPSVDKGKGRARNSTVAVQDTDAPPLWPLPPSINLLPVGGQGLYTLRDHVPEGISMPGGSGSGPHGFMAVIIDPDRCGHSSRNGIHDLYDAFSPAASRIFSNIGSLTLLALFQAVKKLSPDREPRAIYGCLVRPRNPTGTVDVDGIADPVQEQRARDKGQTYVLGADDTTLLWSDRTVRSFFATVERPPWVLIILRRSPTHGRGDTPPRGPQVTLDPQGAVVAAPPLPVRPRASLESRRDMMATLDRVERLKRRMEEELRALGEVASELGLEDDPLSVHVRMCLRALAKWKPYRKG